MTAQDLIRYWQTTAQEALETANILFTANRYDHALFFCHLALENLLKGLVVQKTNTHALPIHDLGKLATQAGIAMTQQQMDYFKEITTWNVKARYDNIKRQFYRKATHTFATAWFIIVKELFLWLTKLY